MVLVRLLVLIALLYLPISSFSNPGLLDSSLINNPETSLLGQDVLLSTATTSPFANAAQVFTLREGSWNYTVTAGADAGSADSESIRRLQAQDDSGWRRVRSNGQQTDFLLNADGVFKTRITNPDHKLAFEYSPGEPELVNGMKVGEARKMAYNVRVSKLATPQQTYSTGSLVAEITYLGQVMAKTGAGELTAYGFKKIVTGNIGPSTVNTTSHVFYTPNVGQVARIDHTDVQAVMIYHSDTKAAYLLKDAPSFIN